MNRFKGKVVLITGSSHGIGAACALRFAGEGADIIVNGRKMSEEAEAVLNQIESMGRKAVFIGADVGVVQEVRGLIGKSISEFGTIDILVNNAGVERNRSFLEVTEADYELVMNTNLKSVFFGSQAFAKHCIEKNKGGIIINMSSVHEEIPFPHFAPYSASKGGLKMLTRNLATELAPYHIRVNNVAPGAIATDINQSMMQNPGQMKKLLKNIPQGRMGKPGDVAAIVAFLASDDAGYVTGSTYFVDGGLTYFYTEQ